MMILRLATTVALASALAACALGRSPRACDAPAAADTAGWHEFRPCARFALLLPASAHENPMQCMDSACGQVNVGSWTLHYDMGRMAGPGDSVHAPLGTADTHECALTIAGRPGHLMTGRNAERGAPGRDGAAIAALPVSADEGGLYLSADSLDDRGLAEFVAAVRSVRLIPLPRPGGP